MARSSCGIGALDAVELLCEGKLCVVDLGLAEARDRGEDMLMAMAMGGGRQTDSAGSPLSWPDHIVQKKAMPLRLFIGRN